MAQTNKGSPPKPSTPVTDSTVGVAKKKKPQTGGAASTVTSGTLG